MEGYLGTEAFDFYTSQMWDYEFQECYVFWPHRKFTAGQVVCLVRIHPQKCFNLSAEEPALLSPSVEWICSVGEGYRQIVRLHSLSYKRIQTLCQVVHSGSPDVKISKVSVADQLSATCHMEQVITICD